MRVGIGYDVHRLVANRKLIMGGVNIPFEMGLLGHSDADVLTHAICDAILGAATLGDIGQHFPDSDPVYKSIDSLILLKKVMELILSDFDIENIDSTIICQRPKLAPYIPEMRNRLARILQVLPNQVNIKATTSEGLGFVGVEKGIAAQAICALRIKL
ncbi:TPA: 2-C-methyl-D-erythritol 2,4-cyclodiphosphate synthase [Candidatus Poribacteria bacterium]|nr:2-C-methyl-D-erythritol 2,4-cyclodiphosphate synthase [Candidatus Poribacteria bacterium]HIA66557.1 2-C-methyl-D-erythritol 2,4-cyclodiphosphate synthase [Candidatus Poribacteria bacterium]HIB89292.1 2-C-methyl-D-erythritol 2,4-cyclodiphosphate synthase [Candidatus Poribacteria bacterium]HIC03183.1 2-C-methyl-D-erythritol 2,4-cyclodiphosphate synthase [Candidatus Poribacteria bacterium]HIC16582.1 2-C-methyl-D-erythritol 2,4-cyclodiphosphate synthase [Candidatus Poribacteria bacterium]